MNTVYFYSGQEKIILCKEWSYKGKDGREGIIKYELILDISSCISKRYIKKKVQGISFFGCKRSYFTASVQRIFWRDNTLDYQLLKFDLCLTKETTSTIKLVDDTFKSKGFMSRK